MSRADAESTEATTRPMSLLDLMGLVVAFGVGFWLLRIAESNYLFGFQLTWLNATRLFIHLAPPLSLALIPIRLRRPRPDREALWRQPGWQASVGVALATAYTLAELSHQFLDPEFRLHLRLSMTPVSVVILERFENEFAVAATWCVSTIWLTHFMGGHRKAERSWIDRLGRLLGWGWILLPALSFLGRTTDTVYGAVCGAVGGF